MKFTTLAKLTAAPCALAVSLAAAPAFAQDAPCVDADENGICDSEETVDASGDPVAGDDVILVTGSRISRPNFDTVEPSVVVSGEQIEARGFTNLGQALNEQPSFGVPGSSPVGGQSDFGQGQSFVNFLGLGSQRTLTIVNGKRFVSSNTASIFGPTGAGSQVDLNVIPTKLIERVETIAVGGAPIYGADAISGTINIITRTDFQGIELDGQYGISDDGDAQDWRIRGLAGTDFADGRGNIIVAGEYANADGLVQRDRPNLYTGAFYRRPNDPNSPFLRQLYQDRRIPSIAETGAPVVGGAVFGLDFPLSPENSAAIFGSPAFNFNVIDGNGNSLKFDENGNLIPIEFGEFAGAPGTFGIDFQGGNGFSLTDVSNLFSPTERYSGIAIANFDFTDSLSFFGEAWYSRSKGTNLRAQPVYNTGLFDAPGTPDGNIIVNLSNPFLTQDARDAIQFAIDNNPLSDQNFLGVAGQDYFYLGRANTDLQSGFSEGTVEVMRFVAGLEGTFELGENEWNWTAYGNYGRSETNGRSRELIQQNFANAIDPIVDGSGNIVCRPGSTNASIPSINPTCTPLNIFGTNINSQAALDYVTAIAEPRSFNELTNFVASVAGPIFALPGGDFSVALGYEYREESQNFDPGAFFLGELDPVTGDRVSFGRSVPIQPVIGSYNTNEIFGEFLAELISPGTGAKIDLLEIKGAARYVDNSIAGGDLTWTLGGRIRPIADLTFRGNYTRAIRAPAITEAFNPSSDFFGFAADPCDFGNIGNGPDPQTRAANCAAVGITQPFSSLSNSRSFSQAIAGNEDLENEQADSFTIGAVWTPGFIPRLRMTVDYVDVNLKDVISQLGASTVVANCYDSQDFPNNQFCGRISRDAQNQLDFIETGYFNSSFLRYQGIISALEYVLPEVAGGDLGFSVSYQFLDTLSSQADESSVPGQTDDSIGYSKHQGVATLSWATNDRDFGAFVQTSFIGGTQISPQVADNFYPEGDNDIPPIVFVNVGANAKIMDTVTLRLVVDNVLDQEPPFPFPASGGTITYFRGVLGRYFRIGASVEF